MRFLTALLCPTICTGLLETSLPGCRILLAQCALWFDAILVHQQPAHHWPAGMPGSCSAACDDPVYALLCNAPSFSSFQ